MKTINYLMKSKSYGESLISATDNWLKQGLKVFYQPGRKTPSLMAGI